MADGTRRFTKDSRIVSRRIDSEMLLVPVRDGVSDLECIYLLNEVAARIWELIDGETDLSQIARKITGEFDVSYDNAAADLAELVTQLEASGSITAANGAGSHRQPDVISET